MKKSFFFLLIAIPFLLASGVHKYYFSVTQVDYSSKNESLQIITRVFYDDLEKALQERYDADVRVDKTYPKEKLNKYISSYLNAKLRVEVNGKEQKLDYLGHENEKDYVVCYIEIKDIKDPQEITVENTLLMGVFPEQKNVVHLNLGKNKKSFLLIRGNDKAVLKFSK